MADSDATGKIEELQILEQHLQNFLYQRQAVESELGEINNALEEINNSEEIFRISAGIMFASTKDKARADLEEKKKLAEMRLKAIEDQEKIMEKNSASLRKELNHSQKN